MRVGALAARPAKSRPSSRQCEGVVVHPIELSGPELSLVVAALGQDRTWKRHSRRRGLSMRPGGGTRWNLVPSCTARLRHCQVLSGQARPAGKAKTSPLPTSAADSTLGVDGKNSTPDAAQERARRSACKECRTRGARPPRERAAVAVSARRLEAADLAALGLAGLPGGDWTSTRQWWWQCQAVLLVVWRAIRGGSRTSLDRVWSANPSALLSSTRRRCRVASQS